MKKTLLILCALLLTSIGATAQIPYEFHAEDWVSLDLSRLTADNITYNADNTITVAPNDGASGQNNVALGNNWTYTGDTGSKGITTANYYVTNEQCWYTVVGTNLSTASGASKLWWMNGANWGEWDPTQVVTLSDGKVLVSWDLSTMTEIDVNLQDEENLLTGWTGGGLTATGTTATISYIGFCTADEVNESFTIPTNTYVHACTANRNVWTVDPATSDELVWLDTNPEKTDGSGMAPPALSYYTTDGNKLPDATITHENIEGLTAGVYEVSMLIRIIDYDTNDDGTYFTLGPGTTFNANGVSQDIYLGVDAHDGSYTEPETETTEASDHEDLYGTYTLYVTVAEGGSLTVSLDIKDATYNWIMFKNLKVRLLDEGEIPTVSGQLSAEYGTLILPFDVETTDVPTGITAYTGTLNEDKDELTLTAVEGTTLSAGVPYIIGGSSGTSYTFSGVPTVYTASNPDASGLLVGTLVDMKQENGDFTQDGTQYVLQNQSSGLGFYPITGESDGVELNAYHCYLTLNSSTGPDGVKGFISLPGSDDEATRIVAVESEEESTDAGAIYDLSGRKVSKAVKGVYIQNGKKVLVK